MHPYRIIARNHYIITVAMVHNLGTIQVVRQVGSGYRLPPPPGCPRAIYTIMIQCW